MEFLQNGGMDSSRFPRGKRGLKYKSTRFIDSKCFN